MSGIGYPKNAIFIYSCWTWTWLLWWLKGRLLKRKTSSQEAPKTERTHRAQLFLFLQLTLRLFHQQTLGAVRGAESSASFFSHPPPSSPCADSSHSQQSAYRLLSVQIKEGPPHFTWLFSTVFSRRIIEEVREHPASLCLKSSPCLFLFFFCFSSPGSILLLNTRTCSVDTRRATSTLVDMCVKQSCQFQTLCTVLLLAAAVAEIHGQGKNLRLGAFVLFWNFSFFHPSFPLSAKKRRQSLMTPGSRFSDLQVWYKC